MTHEEVPKILDFLSARMPNFRLAFVLAGMNKAEIDHVLNMELTPEQVDRISKITGETGLAIYNKRAELEAAFEEQERQFAQFALELIKSVKLNSVK